MKIRIVVVLAFGIWHLAFGYQLSAFSYQLSDKSLSFINYQLSIPFVGYEQLWKQVDSLSDIGLPKSALAIVQRIYTQSKKEKNDPQFIKSVMYRIKLEADFQEGFLLTSIDEVKSEIVQAKGPVRQILNSILAELYWRYYQENRYRFNDRSRILDNRNDSIQTWDITTLSRKIIQTYMISLENTSQLQGIAIKDFDAILEKPEPGQVPPMRKKSGFSSDLKGSSALRPTLYDFLSWRALEYFMSTDGPKNVSADRFRIDNPGFFSQAPLFAGMSTTPPDSSSLDYFAIRIFRDLAAFHLRDKDPGALIDEELHRFNFVYENGEFSDSIGDRTPRGTMYLDALTKLEQTYLQASYSTDVSFAIGQFLNEQGQLYRPNESDQYKWDLKSAVACCQGAIDRFPESDGAKNCKILKDQILQPGLQVTTENAVITGKPFLALVGFKNFPSIYFRLVKTDPVKTLENQGNMDREAMINQYLELPVLRSWLEILPGDGDLQQHSIELPMPGIPEGYYILLCSSGKDFTVKKDVIAFTDLYSTRISYISQRKVNGGIDFYILDRETGTPIKNALIESYVRNYNYNTRNIENVKTGTYVTDTEGFLTIPPDAGGTGNSGLYLKIKVKNDLLLTSGFYLYPLRYGKDKPSLQTFFFTDRSIYRPGQIIYYKGIITEKYGDNYSIKPGVKTTIILQDVNNQKISEQTFTTNEFGSFNGSFTAPQGVLLGQMTISNGSGSAGIAVEEYKRPTFEVTFEPVEGNYRLDKPVTVKGKAMAYSGHLLDGANVKFRVIRAARFPYWNRWWIPFPVSPETEILNGEVKTGTDGIFTITFTALPDKTLDRTTNPVFDYLISADVTDINGETQSSQSNVSVGYTSLLLGMSIPEKLNINKDSVFRLTATNLNGQQTPTLVKVTIQRLKQPIRFFKTRLWEKPDLAFKTSQEFHSQFPYDVYDDEDNPAKWQPGEVLMQKEMNTLSDTAFRFSLFALKQANGEWRTTNGSKLMQGNYLLTLQAKDPFGQNVETRTWFTLFDPASRDVPVQALNWFVPLNVKGEPGEKAQFLIGSKEEDVQVIYEVRMHDSLVSRKWLTLSDNQLLVEVPIKEEFRGNFLVNFSFVRDNRAFQNSQLVTVPFTNKKLDITIESFRNKLEPGQKEEWKIRIKDAENKGVNAEFLTTMYDASLDAFRPHSWAFSILPTYYISEPWEIRSGFSTSSGMGSGPVITHDNDMIREHQYDRLNWFGFNYFVRGRGFFKGGANRLMDQAPMAVEGIVSEKSMESGGLLDKKTVDTTNPQTGSKNSASVNPSSPFSGYQLRRDFRETAFFYPSIVTDSTGNLSMQFTVPESLTKWKMMGFGYTKNLRYGQIEKELVTRKELMVIPNSPRFVRQGDTVVFSAKVVNMSDRALSGEVVLKFLDALTQESVNVILYPSPDPSPKREGNIIPTNDNLPTANSEQRMAFSIPLGESSSFQWKLYIPADPSLSLLQYQIVAKAGNFSDGEEKAFPVLTNRMLVTESVPLPVRGKGSFDFTFDKLLKSTGTSSLKSYNLTLEFASNPAWYAIQALPVLDEPKYPSADNIFNAYYANSIASFIVNSNPSIKRVFESWKNSTPDALLSNLEKNQELKSALLRETPWVLEAKSESECKQRLSLLFDLNTLSNRLEENLSRLQKMQLPNGGWSWFEGMPESRYMTQNILTGLGHLDHLGVKSISNDRATWNMVSRAIVFLDGEMVKEYENIKKYDPGKMDQNHLSSTQIQYLYARSYFYSDQKPEARSQPAFDYFIKQAEKYWTKQDIYLQGMIALALNRLGNKEVPKSILRSLSEKALHSNEMGMYWASPAGYYWYQAPIESQSLLIETYDEVLADQKSVDEMKIWLLKQKQTQDWKTSRATVEACYALLLRGTDLLSVQPEVKFKIGQELIEPEKLRDTKVEAGTGYFQVSWQGKEIVPEMGRINIQKDQEGVAWGALYWQYFEDLDKITPAQTPLKIEKKLFIETNKKDGPALEEITNGNKVIDTTTSHQFISSSVHQLLKTGDKLKVRIILKVDRNLEFVHMKDMRASAFEPYLPSKSGVSAGNGMSGYHYQDGLGYYQSTSDVATNFFFDYLPKGTWVFEYPLVVNAAGDYSNGITTVQCMYAPEFSAHSEGIRVQIAK